MRLLVPFLAAVVTAQAALCCAPGLADACRRLPPIEVQIVPWVVLPAGYSEQEEAVGFDDERDSFSGELDRERSTDHERRGLGSNERLIDRVTDPTAWLMDFRFRELSVFSMSDSDEDSNTVDFRTQMPFLLWGQINLLRVDVPYNTSGSKGPGLGDVVLFDLLVFDAPWGRWGIGPGTRLIPDANGEDSFLLGPVAGTVAKNEHWTLGILSENYFSGDNSLSELQPILAYKFNEQFALGIGESKFKYDWSKGAWTQLPLGVEAKYIADLWGQKIEFFINPQYSFRNSNGNPEWMLYVGLTLLVPEA